MACRPVPAPAGGTAEANAAPAPGVVEWVARDYTYDAPERLPAGWVTIRMTNHGQEPHHGQLLRLNDGVTYEEFATALAIVMEDVAAALGEYSRERPLPVPAALARAKQVLDGLARLHAWWEQPAQRARARRCPWLVSTEQFLRVEAANYAAALLCRTVAFAIVMIRLPWGSVLA